MNRAATVGLVLLSTIALSTILSATLTALLSGQLLPAETDEGIGAHIFQLSIAAMLPVGIVFLATADGTAPSRLIRRLAFPTFAVIAAFALLYVFEHYLHRI